MERFFIKYRDDRETSTSITEVFASSEDEAVDKFYIKRKGSVIVDCWSENTPVVNLTVETTYIRYEACTKINLKFKVLPTGVKFDDE